MAGKYWKVIVICHEVSLNSYFQDLSTFLFLQKEKQKPVTKKPWWLCYCHKATWGRSCRSGRYPIQHEQSWSQFHHKHSVVHFSKLRAWTNTIIEAEEDNRTCCPDCQVKQWRTHSSIPVTFLTLVLCINKYPHNTQISF